jgi:hypothetical protein
VPHRPYSNRFHPRRRQALALLAFPLWSSAAPPAGAQERQERDGVVLNWGLVPAAIASRQHAIEELHGGRPPGGGSVHHLVLALFDARTGRRIDEAIVRAQLLEPRGVPAAPRYVPPMQLDGADDVERVALHQDDLGAFDGDVRPRADRETQGSFRWRRRPITVPIRPSTEPCAFSPPPVSPPGICC